MPPKKKISIIDIAKKKEQVQKEKQEERELKHIEKVNREWMEKLENRYRMKEIRIYTNFKDRLLKFGFPVEHLDKIPENMFETELEFKNWWKEYSVLIQGKTKEEIEKLYKTLMKNARNLLLSYRVRDFKVLTSDIIPEDIVYHDGVEVFDDIQIYDLNGSDMYLQEFKFEETKEQEKEKVDIPEDFIKSVNNMISTSKSQYVYYVNYERLYNMYLYLYEKESKKDIGLRLSIVLETMYPILFDFDKNMTDKLFLVLYYPERRLDVKYYEDVSKVIKEMKKMGETIDYDEIMKNVKSDLYPEFEYGIIDALDKFPELNELLDLISIEKLVDMLKQVWDYNNTEQNKMIFFYDLLKTHIERFIFPKQKFAKYLIDGYNVYDFTFPKYMNADTFLYFWDKTPSFMPTPEQILYKVLDISYLHPELVNIIFRQKKIFVNEKEFDEEPETIDEDEEFDYPEEEEEEPETSEHIEGVNFKDLERYVIEDNTYKNINMVLKSNSQKLLKSFFNMSNAEAYNQLNNYIRIIYTFINRSEYNISNIYISGLLLFMIYFYNDYLRDNLKMDDNYKKIRNYIIKKLNVMNTPGIIKTKINKDEIDELVLLMTNHLFTDTINFNENGTINLNIKVSDLLQVRGKIIVYEPIHPDNIFLELIKNNNIDELKKEFHNLTRYAKFVNHRYIRMSNPDVYIERSNTINSILGYNKFTDASQKLTDYQKLLNEYKTILLQGMKSQKLKRKLLKIQNQVFTNYNLAIEDFNYVLVYELGIVVDYIQFNPLDEIEKVYTHMYRARINPLYQFEGIEEDTSTMSSTMTTEDENLLSLIERLSIGETSTPIEEENDFSSLMEKLSIEETQKPEPKKRGRKPKPKENIEPKEPKKRGRKPKN